ncbi:hypothetical protein ACFO9Q_00070 [Paenibacillus sp. GCM10023252]|uniref:hypothetical protein n=1 Tax=Paenibacillus sp. GCM10023252 TaxID=3252649 RepID=UPI0036238E8A
MNDTNRTLFLSLLYALQVGAGLWILEAVEGSKIRASHHLDLAPFAAFIGSSTAIPFYFLTFYIIDRACSRMRDQAARSVIQVLTYTAISGWTGHYLFHLLYEQQEVNEFGLQIETAIILFGMIGLITGTLSEYSRRPPRSK